MVARERFAQNFIPFGLVISYLQCELPREIQLSGSIKQGFGTRALTLDRDLNASRNVLDIGWGPPDLKPVERLTSTWPLEAGQVGSVNQEASLLVGR